MNVGAAVKLPPRKDTLSERILTEADVQNMLVLDPNRLARGLSVDDAVARGEPGFDDGAALRRFRRRRRDGRDGEGRHALRPA